MPLRSAASRCCDGCSTARRRRRADPRRPHLCAGLPGNSAYQRNKIACALLGLEVETSTWGSADPDGTLQRYAAGGDDQRLRAALAIALAEGERVPRLWQASSGSGWADEITVAHFAHLRAHGHTPTPTEAQSVAGAGAPLIDVLHDQDDVVDAEVGK